MAELPLSNKDLDLGDKDAVIDAALKERDWFADEVEKANATIKVMRQALLDIKRHQETIGDGVTRYSTTWFLANRALDATI